MTMGLTPYRGAATGSDSAPAVQPEPSSGAVEEASVAGAAADQPVGTDSPPTEDASPIAAVAAPPRPFVDPTSVVPMPKPAPRGVTSLTNGVRPPGEVAMRCPRLGKTEVKIPWNHAVVTPTWAMEFWTNGIEAHWPRDGTLPPSVVSGSKLESPVCRPERILPTPKPCAGDDVAA